MLFWAGHGQRALECYLGLARLDFGFHRFENYGHYFSDSSTLTLAEAGTYTGAQSIAEYVTFVSSNSPFLSFAGEGSVDVQLMDIEDDICHFFVPTLFQGQKWQLPAVPSGEVTVSIMTSFYYNMLTEKIIKLNVFYHPGFLAFVFAWAVNTDASRTYVCQTLNSYCPEVWDANNLTSQTCIEKMSLLPTTTVGYVDGNSQGCRVLHASMASLSAKHCPHLSFVPMVDECGKMKCQESHGVRPDDLFDPEEFDLFREFMAIHGVGESGWSLREASCYTSRDCPATYGCSAGFCVSAPPSSVTTVKMSTRLYAYISTFFKGVFFQFMR